MTDIFEYLSARPYPGRGILLGTGEDGKLLCAYFIMGRSENSRNRVFERTPDGIRTRAFDESKMTDPSLIIYNPVRRRDGAFIVTNGDQTDTIYDMGDFTAALRTRSFEPDGPNWTPRVSGIYTASGHSLSILKAADAEGTRCLRYFFEYENVPGACHFISTYEGFGSPLPSFSGEPVEAKLPGLGARELAERLWAALDEDNRVSLYAISGGEEIIINKHGEEA